MKPLNLCALTAAFALLPGAALAQLTLLSQFNETISGSLIGTGYDPSAGKVWLYGGGGTLYSYTSAGTFSNSIDQPGETANDADVEFTSGALTLGTTLLPANTLLHINGETSVAEIYAVDKTSGAVLSSLTTAFGNSHVVGGAHHAARGTFFLVQDNVPGGELGNKVAEINPVTGAVIGTPFSTNDFDVNFGDIEVIGATGNLLLVSSNESTIREVTPTGAFVRDYAYPAGVTPSISGIALDDATGELYLGSTGGVIYRVGGLQAVPEPATLAALGLGAAALLRRRRRSAR